MPAAMRTGISSQKQVAGGRLARRSGAVVRRRRAEGPLPGIPNRGNTCFMNSVLQCLFNAHGEALGSCRNYLPVDQEIDFEAPKDAACFSLSALWSALTPEPTPEPDKLSAELLARRFVELYEEYDSSKEAIPSWSRSLQVFHKTMGVVNSRFSCSTQEDAHEFLGTLLMALDEMFSHKMISGPVVTSICGVESYSLRQCKGCLEFSERDQCTDLTLGLPTISTEAQTDAERRREELATPVSLEALLQLVRRPEEIEGVECHACGRRCAMVQRAGLVQATGDVLIIVLYRFLNVFDEAARCEQVKVSRPVVIPNVFAMEGIDYELRGTVNHHGEDVARGHYTATVRSTRDGLWYDCNDSLVSAVKDLDPSVENTFARLDSKGDPYILFYTRSA